MDILIKRMIDEQVRRLNNLARRAIGSEFKCSVQLAIRRLQQSGGLHGRIERTLRVRPQERDRKRVSAGGLSVDGMRFTLGHTAADPATVLQSLEQVQYPAKLPATLAYTADATAVAANQPQAVNLMALLSNDILKSDPLSNWKGVFDAALTLGGVVTTTAAFVAGGGAAAALGVASAGCTYTGALSMLSTSAPDFAPEALKNYIACISAWNEKAALLLAKVDPRGAWCYADFRA